LTKINIEEVSATVEWMDAGEAAKRLGVKPQTLYAYVSRGVLRRHRGEDGRSRFDAAEVERLARRGRPRRGPAPAEVLIESQITALGADRPYYRGRDALELAAHLDFEAVAGWLWTGSAPTEDGGPWRAAPEAVATGRAVQARLPEDMLPLERLQVIVPALGATDPRRHTFDPPAVVAVGQSLIAGMVDCLPPAGPAVPGPGHPIAARLWSKLTPAPATPGLVDALGVALVLLADHELAASALAARVAASVRADPYAVVSAGLAAMGGALHGGASLGAEALLAEVRHGQEASQALGMRLRRGERIPGFGHSVYKGQDGRGALLLDRVRATASGHPGPATASGHDALAAADAVLAEARRRRLPEFNVDFALAVLTAVAGMASGAGETIFAIARTVGWLAHALEEYANPTRLRLRAAYVGRPPGPA
jgi:citrate synthase